jgi:SAM-dependent methyltransferase
MATDLDAIVLALGAFFDVVDRTVVWVGAGGGQLVEYARRARRVIAIDRDARALERAADRARATGLIDRCTLLHADFLDVDPRGDVVLLDFCLHEMADPDRAIDHAERLAPDVVVVDHAPESPWAWYAAEDALMTRAWSAVERHATRRRRDLQAHQVFADFAELSAKLAAQGPTSRERIAELRGRAPVTVPMPYRLALLGSGVRR